MHYLREWTLAIALYVALVLDGSLSFYLHQLLHFKGITASPWLLPIGIMLIALFDEMNSKEIWLALGAGVVADIYFLGIIGIYTVALPLLSWVGQKIARFLPETFWARLIAVLLGVCLFDLYSILLFSLLKMMKPSLSLLWLNLGLNLLWAALFFTLTYWIWGSLSRNYPFLNDLQAYQQ